MFLSQLWIRDLRLFMKTVFSEIRLVCEHSSFSAEVCQHQKEGIEEKGRRGTVVKSDGSLFY